MTLRSLRNLLLVPIALALVSGPSVPCLALAQDSKKGGPEFLLGRMTGKWVMRGTIAGEKVTHDVTVDRILGGRYVRIHEIAREKDRSGQPSYEAWIHIAWDKAKGEFVVMWLDNTATTNFSADGVGHGKPAGDKIPFVWKLADGSGIRNTFAYLRAGDEWSWRIDNVDKAGKSSAFGRVTLKRR